MLGALEASQLVPRGSSPWSHLGLSRDQLLNTRCISFHVAHGSGAEQTVQNLFERSMTCHAQGTRPFFCGVSAVCAIPKTRSDCVREAGYPQMVDGSMLSSACCMRAAVMQTSEASLAEHRDRIDTVERICSLAKPHARRHAATLLQHAMGTLAHDGRGFPFKNEYENQMDQCLRASTSCCRGAVVAPDRV